MLILVLIEILFHIVRGLFIGYIVKRLFNQSRLGLIAIILYFGYTFVQFFSPYINGTGIILTLIPMIVTLILYAQLFQMTHFRLKKRLTSVSLDIYTIWYEQSVLRIVSILLIILLILFQFMAGPLNIIVLSILTLLIIGYNIFQILHDQDMTSHIIIRLGKDSYTYVIKPIPSRTKLLKYSDFFSSDMYVLDKIATVQYKKDMIKRMDYIYAIKADITFTEQGFTKEDIPYIDTLNTLKHYQLVKVKITKSNINVKRLK